MEATKVVFVKCDSDGSCSESLAVVIHHFWLLTTRPSVVHQPAAKKVLVTPGIHDEVGMGFLWLRLGH